MGEAEGRKLFQAAGLGTCDLTLQNPRRTTKSRTYQGYFIFSCRVLRRSEKNDSVTGTVLACIQEDNRSSLTVASSACIIDV